MVVKGKVLNDFPRFVGILIAEFAAGAAVNLALKMKRDIIIKKLDLKPTIDAMMRDFLEITTARRVSTVRRIKTRERIKMKIVYQDYLRDKRNLQEELFTHKEEMDLETAQTTTTAKLPILKQGEYDMWRLRIEQYFQVQDYALWDVIENGNSFKLVAQTTTNADGTSTLLIPGPVTTKENIQKKNDVKARSMLWHFLTNI
ncbi:hypothetical protein Tco_0621717 [Tanacetum coccineum]